MVDRITRATQSMEALISDLLDLAKIEGGRFAVSPRSISADAIVQEGLALIEAVAEQKHVRLESVSAGVHVRADHQRVLQVMSNLLGNAVKFTPECGKIKVTVEQHGAWAQFSIEDSGPGIAPRDLAHVFERYWQGRGVARQSAGLGLYIARGIVEAHGGKIRAENRPGGGTIFRFTLRAAAIEESVHVD